MATFIAKIAIEYSVEANTLEEARAIAERNFMATGDYHAVTWGIVWDDCDSEIAEIIPTAKGIHSSVNYVMQDNGRIWVPTAGAEVTI